MEFVLFVSLLDSFPIPSFLENPLVWVLESTGFLCLSDSSIHKMANSWVLEQREIKEKIVRYFYLEK